MSFIVLSPAAVEQHTEHQTKRPTCPLCDRFGPGESPAVYAGRLISINPPYSAESSEW